MPTFAGAEGSRNLELMSPIRSKLDYEHALDLVRAAISAWDPYRLVEGGAPPDEFDSEIAEIVRRSRQITTPADAVTVVSEVFAAAFEPKYFSGESCKAEGARIFEMLDSHGYLSDVAP